MRIGEVILAVAATLSLMAGAALQQQAPEAKAQTGGLSAKKLFASAKTTDYIGDAKCAECHEEKTANFHKSGHAAYMAKVGLPIDKIGCEACHGPGAIHTRDENPIVIAYGKITAKEVSEACLRCHGDVMKTSHWGSTAHAKANVSCVSCHQIHPDDEKKPGVTDHGLVKTVMFPSAKKTDKLLKADEATLCSSCHRSEVAKFRQNSHHPIPEGQMVCSDCHSIHPTATAKHPAAGMKQACVTCHTEKAGPFVFEHDPVAGFTGGGCTECHDSHGSHNPSLLKGFSRGLCIQCHNDKGSGHHGGKSCWNAGCHVAIHGSNTDRNFTAR